MTTNSKSLFSWPANPTLTALHLVARATLVMTNVVGLSVSYAAGDYSGMASFWVAATFMSASLVIFQPIFVVWNHRQLRRSKMASWNETVAQQLQTAVDLSPARLVSTKFLAFAIIMDTIGVLGYWIVWGFTLQDAVNGAGYYYSSGADTTLMSYAGAATLTCAIVHSFLLGTQLLQFIDAQRAKSTVARICPNCHHSLNEIASNNSNSKTGRNPPPIMMSAQQEESQNLLGRESYEDTDSDRQTVIDAPTPGQETGTCAITPRVSTSSSLMRTSNTGVVIDSEMSENDRFMEKIACDLHVTTQGGWLSRVLPNLA